MGSRKERSRRHRSRDKHRRRRRRSRSRSRHSRSRKHSGGGIFSRIKSPSMSSMSGKSGMSGMRSMLGLSSDCTLVVENIRENEDLLLPIKPYLQKIEIHKEGGKINKIKEACFKKKIETVTQKILNSKYNELKIEDILNSFLYFKVTELYSINNTLDRNYRQITKKRTYDEIKGFLYYYIGDSFKDLNIMKKIYDKNSDNKEDIKKDKFDKIFKLLDLLNEKSQDRNSKDFNKKIYGVIPELYKDILIFINDKDDNDLNNHLFEKAYKEYLDDNDNKIPYTHDPNTDKLFKKLWKYTLLKEDNDINNKKFIELLIKKLKTLQELKNKMEYGRYILNIWSILEDILINNFNEIKKLTSKLTSKLIEEILIMNMNIDIHNISYGNISLIQSILNKFEDDNDKILYLYNIIKDNEDLKTIIYYDDKIFCKIISLVNNKDEKFIIVNNFIKNISINSEESKKTNKNKINNLIQCLITNKIKFKQDKLTELKNIMKEKKINKDYNDNYNFGTTNLYDELDELSRTYFMSEKEQKELDDKRNKEQLVKEQRKIYERYELHIDKLLKADLNKDDSVNKDSIEKVNSIPKDKLLKKQLSIENINIHFNTFNNNKLEIKNEKEIFKIKNEDIKYKWNLSDESKCKDYKKLIEENEQIPIRIATIKEEIEDMFASDSEEFVKKRYEKTETRKMLKLAKIHEQNDEKINELKNENFEFDKPGIEKRINNIIIRINENIDSSKYKNGINLMDELTKILTKRNERPEINDNLIKSNNKLNKINTEYKDEKEKYKVFHENINIYMDNINKFRTFIHNDKIYEIIQELDILQKEYNKEFEIYSQIDNKIYIYEALEKPSVNKICDQFIFQFNINDGLKTNPEIKNYNLYYSNGYDNIINNKIERYNYKIIEKDNNVIVRMNKNIMNIKDKITFYFLNYEKEYSKYNLYVLENNKNKEKYKVNKLYLKFTERIDISEEEKENKLIVNNYFNTTNTENFPKENLKDQSTLYRIDGINKANLEAGISPDDVTLADKKQGGGKSRKIRKRLSRKYATRRKSSRDRSRKERYLLKRERLKLRVERKKLEKERRRRSRK